MKETASGFTQKSKRLRQSAILEKSEGWSFRQYMYIQELILKSDCQKSWNLHWKLETALNSKMDSSGKGVPINCTAGAIPIKNEKGEYSRLLSKLPCALSFHHNVFFLSFLILNRRVDYAESESQQICSWQTVRILYLFNSLVNNAKFLLQTYIRY